MFTLRPAHPSEAELLSALALRSKAHWGYAPAFLDACRRELTYTEDDIQSDESHFVVAEEESSCIGFYSLVRTSSDVAELDALFVEPSHIGRGLGRALIDHATRLAAGWGISRMIIQGDPHAEAFYRAAGGVRTGYRESGSIPGRYLPLFTIDLGSIRAV